MYSRQEASQLRQAFWTAFGQYMQPVLSAEGEKLNWINYKTGEKNILFRMQADNKEAHIGIEITHKDEGIRQLYFEQFQQLKKIFEAISGNQWIWQEHYINDAGLQISRICQIKKEVSIFKKEDWPELISFFKPRIIALDEFWANVKHSFEALR